jgi:glycosyltransferase involved in cell wall biosynthesis
MLQVLRVLADAGFQAHVACPAGDLADRSVELGATWHPFSFTQRRLLTAGRRLPRPQAAAARLAEGRALTALASEVGADVVHTGALIPHVDTQAGGRRLRARTLWHVNQVSPSYLFAGPLPARIVGVSRAALAPAAWRPGAVARSVVVPNGIDVDRFRPPTAAERAGAREALGLGDELTIVTVARLEPLKGVDVVIRAAAASGVSPALVIVGDATGYSGGDEYAQGLRKLAADVGLDVRFLGSRPDVAKVLWAGDLFAFMSRWEAFGLVLAEASAAGLPVLASNTGGCAEVVVGGVTGDLVAPDDVAGCAAAIAGLAADAGRRSELGAAGRRHAVEHFDLATFGARMLPHYLALAGMA